MTTETYVGEDVFRVAEIFHNKIKKTCIENDLYIFIDDSILSSVKSVLENYVTATNNKPLSKAKIHEIYALILKDCPSAIKKGISKDNIPYLLSQAKAYATEKGLKNVKDIAVLVDKNLVSFVHTFKGTIRIDCENTPVIRYTPKPDDEAMYVVFDKLYPSLKSIEDKGLTYYINPTFDAYKTIKVSIPDDLLEFQIINRPAEKNKKLPEVDLSMREKTVERMTDLINYFNQQNPKLMQGIKYIPNKGIIIDINGVPMLLNYNAIIRTDLNTVVVRSKSSDYKMRILSEFLRKNANYITREKSKFILDVFALSDNHRKNLPIPKK